MYRYDTESGNKGNDCTFLIRKESTRFCGSACTRECMRARMRTTPSFYAIFLHLNEEPPCVKHLNRHQGPDR